MKILKWLAIVLITLVLVISIGVAALVYLVDWNDQKDRIQSLVKAKTGRDLVIAGDLSPSVFPWAGISVGDITLSNAEGFGERPFAHIDSADVKVKLLPLLKRQVNIRTVQLVGLDLDLQQAADGTTNWDDLVQGTTTTTTTEDEAGGDGEVTTEVEASNATIAALSVGGIDISDANVRWTDAQAGMDATLSSFGLETGAIELGKPFTLSTEFSVASNSMDIAADIDGAGEVTIDLASQTYTLGDFVLNTAAKGGAFPGGELAASLGANVVAALDAQRIDVSGLALSTLGVELAGNLAVTDLDTAPSVTGELATAEPFSPRELFEKLGIAAPVTADESVLSSASLAMSLAATPQSASISDLQITLDDTTLSGSVGVPSLAGEVPPLRFDLALDAIDVDRYLPPATDPPAGDAPGEETPGTDTPTGDAPAGDAPIVLPEEMLRNLDVDGTLRVGSVKVSGLQTTDIVIPVKASGGKVGVQGLKAQLYEGALDASAGVDVNGDTPSYSVKAGLEGIQADPLLADLTSKDSFLSGRGRFAADIVTRGETVDALTAGLDGTFDSAFTDGSINGINIGYQLRRAKAALSGQSLPADAAQVKTDFSSLAVSGRFDNGVMTSDDLDLRSPLLRVGGAGQVDLPQEAVDYTLTLLVTGTAQGQGGADLASLKGVKLDIPVKGTFAALSENPSGVILDGLKAGFSANLKGQAEALVNQEADKLKAEAKEKLKVKEDELKLKLEQELEGRVDEDTQQQLKDGLKGLLDR